MKRALVLILVAVLSMGFVKNVYASDDVYYTTPNGIELNREEYDFLTSFYGSGYLKIMTQEQYDEFIKEDLMNSDVTIVTQKVPGLALLNPNMGPRSDTHSTQAKTVQIGAACLPNYCIMSILNTWHANPATRSWDNIGAYLSGNTYLSHEHTYVSSTLSTVFYSNLNTATNGVGNSVKLPDTGSDLMIDMAFKVSRNGTVFGSYQHAMNDTTLAVSQNYTFDILGEGGVFDYYGTAIGVYDGMNGVDIDV